MTMLMHTRGLLERVPYSSEGRDTAEVDAGRPHLAMIKRFCVGALTVLAATGALAAIIGLKAAIYYWRFHN